MIDSIHIPRPLANRLLTLAQSQPEAEICGLISSNDDGDLHIYPVENIATDKGCVFEMEPQQQIDAFRKMREQNQQLFAIFHSHPHADAIPSSKDLEDAAYAEALNLIISLNTKGVLDMRGFYYENHQPKQIELVID